jgi:hypothetical protein
MRLHLFSNLCLWAAKIIYGTNSSKHQPDV